MINNNEIKNNNNRGHRIGKIEGMCNKRLNNHINKMNDK